MQTTSLWLKGSAPDIDISTIEKLISYANDSSCSKLTRKHSLAILGYLAQNKLNAQWIDQGNMGDNLVSLFIDKSNDCFCEIILLIIAMANHNIYKYYQLLFQKGVWKQYIGYQKEYIGDKRVVEICSQLDINLLTYCTNPIIKIALTQEQKSSLLYYYSDVLRSWIKDQMIVTSCLMIFALTGKDYSKHIANEDFIKRICSLELSISQNIKQCSLFLHLV